MRLTCDVLGFQLTGTLEVCDMCARLKAQAHAVKKKIYKRAKNTGETVFVDMTGTLPEILIGNNYSIGVVDDYIQYY